MKNSQIALQFYTLRDHLKTVEHFSETCRRTFVSTKRTPLNFRVGRGNLDFPKIIEAAEAAGCKWFIVEQDSCPGDPFEPIRQSFNHLVKITEDASACI